MQWTEEHESIRETVSKFIDNEINPYVDQWEEDGIFPAKEVFKKAIAAILFPEGSTPS